jgi:N-formylmaleamate deformylase
MLRKLYPEEEIMLAQHPYAPSVQEYRPLAELVPAHWQTGTVTAADGTPLHYTRTGDAKPALLLLHGIQVSGISWLRTAQALANEYDVVMPDFRGHGQSGSAANGFSADLLVNDTLTLMNALGLEKPFIIGHSLGADIAGRLAAVYPVRAVILVDPAMQNFAAAMPANVDEAPPWMRAIFETMAALRKQSHTERLLTGLGLLPPGAPLMREEDYVTFIEGQAHFDLSVFRHTAQMRYLIEAPEVIASIACPILLLTARPAMPGASIDKGLAVFKDNWRAGQHVHFEESGHFIQAEQFERFIQVVNGFLHEQRNA